MNTMLNISLPSDGQPVERRVPACGDLQATFYIADSLTRWHGFRPQALGAGSSAISYARPCLCPAAARARRLTEQVSAEQHLLVCARILGGRNLDRHGRGSGFRKNLASNGATAY